MKEYYMLILNRYYLFPWEIKLVAIVKTILKYKSYEVDYQDCLQKP